MAGTGHGIHHAVLIMVLIHELLNRIRWDQGFGRGDFVIGYYGRLEDRIIRAPLHRVLPDPADHFACQVIDAECKSHMVPFHRIREVCKDGNLIWQLHPLH